ncbi:MAG: hypothetical protein AAGL98_15935, partial [Planctomycetota bacterium]
MGSPAPAQSLGDNPQGNLTNRISPLAPRTLRNQPSSIGRFMDYENSPGLTRAVRLNPALDERNAPARLNRFDRSDRWYAREIARGRALLEIPSPRIATSLNPQRLAPGETFTVTNPNATPAPVGPYFADAPQAGDSAVYAVRKSELTDAEKGDSWALLDRG